MKYQKNIRTSVLIFTVFSLFLIQCKSVKVAVLGIDTKKPVPQIQAPVSTSTTATANAQTDASDNFSGIVTNKENHPIADADIFIYKDSISAFYTKSDSLGRYTIPNYKQYFFIDNNTSLNDTTTKKVHRDYKLMIRANGYKNEDKPVVIQTAEQLKSLFSINKAGSVSGRVLKKDGTPVSNALLLFSGTDNSYATAQTNEAGIFIVTQLDNTTYNISVVHEKYSFPGRTIEVKNGADYNGIDFVSYPAAINGDVKVHISNNPIAQALITMQKTDINPQDVNQPYKLVETSGNRGDYKIDGIAVGKYKVQVNAKGYGFDIKSAELNEKQLEKKLDFTLSRQGKISARIINYDPADEVGFFLIDKQLNSRNITDFNIDAKGNFILRGIASGIYDVILKSKNAYLIQQSITVKPDMQTGIYNFIINKSNHSISGRILSKTTNQPIINAAVIVYTNTSGYYAVTDKDGNFKIADIASDNYSLTASAEKYEPLHATDKIIAKDADIKNIDFYLIPIK